MPELTVLKPKTQVEHENLVEELEELLVAIKNGERFSGLAVAVSYPDGTIGTAWFGNGSHYTLLGAVQTLSARMTEEE